jgi:hypothetical protein
MKLEELRKLVEENKIIPGSSEETELLTGEDDFYSVLRDLGYYRVFETYYKDAYQCTQFYGTGFINKENGHRWLLDECPDQEDEPVETCQFDLYIELKDSTKWERKELKVFTGTLKQILEFSQEKENHTYESIVK